MAAITSQHGPACAHDFPARSRGVIPYRRPHGVKLVLGPFCDPEWIGGGRIGDVYGAREPGVDEPPARRGSILGTPNYAADVYPLGCIAIFCLTGGPPFTVVHRITGDEARRWSAVRCAEPVIDVLLGGSSDAVNHIARQLIPRENHFRFQLPLDRKYEAMGNSHPKNVDVLTHVGTDYIDSGEGRRKLDALVGRLNSTG